MAKDIYVDAVGGDDDHLGTDMTTDAVQHVSRALELITNPVEEETGIHLKIGTTANPYDYTFSGAVSEIDLTGIRRIQKPGDTITYGSLTIQPYNWNNTTYQNCNGDPYGLGGSWDPTASKPLVLPKIMMANSDGIRLVGLQFSSGSGPANDYGIMADLSSNAEIAYCLANGVYGGGLIARHNSTVFVENSCISNSLAGVASYFGSHVLLIGNVTIKDCLSYGAFCHQGNLTIRPWNYGPPFYATQISTSYARKKYCGIRGELGAVIVVEDPETNPAIYNVALLRIINEFSHISPEYYGIYLKSKAMFVGTDNLTYAMIDTSSPFFNNGKPTIPEGQQILYSETEGAIVLR